MGSRRTWSTKEEVLRDLAKATGRKVGDLDEDYLVIGARPPPRHIKEDDDEARLLFGETVNGKQMHANEKQPDLKGITQMLRMVNNYDGEEDDSANNNDLNQKNTVITISKLNPNVKEFIPIGDNRSSPSVSDNKGDNINIIKLPDSDKTEIIDTGKTNVSKSSINEEKEKKDDITALADVLKNKISDASKSDSYENKRTKNVAIATLLKLYAKKSPSQSQKTETKQNGLKLMTPQDFQCTKKSVYNNHNGSSDQITTMESTSPESLQSMSSSSGIPVNRCKNMDSNDFNATSTPVNSEPLQTNISPKIVNDNINSEVKASIEKVNKWLDEPLPKKKTPSICLGPISFKRKDAAVKSPASDSEQKISKPSVTIGQYKPSNFAADLGKKYMERSAAKEANQRNAWTNLDEILKERDIEIKKKDKKERLLLAVSHLQ